MSKQVVKGEHDTITDTYLSAVSEGRADSAGYIRDNLKIDKAFGYVKPYVPVVDRKSRRVGKECRIGCRSRWSPYH